MKKICLNLFVLLGLIACNQNKLDYVLGDTAVCSGIDEVASEQNQPVVCKDKDGNFINGQVTQYFANGQTHRVFDISQGIPNGVWKRYNESGVLLVNSHYKNGKLHGNAKVYYENGQLNEDSYYKNDKFHGTSTVYSKNGNIQQKYNYKNGVLDGLQKNWYENGNIHQEMNYKNGKQHGKAKEYYEDGKLEIEVKNKNGNRHGLEKRYYRNGNLEQEVHYKNGKMSGLAKTYYENGNLKTKDNYKDGKIYGRTQTYYENGNLQKDGIIKNGISQGLKLYYENGNLKTEVVTKNGGAVEYMKQYKEDGSVTNEMFLRDGSVYTRDETDKEYIRGEVLLDKFKSNIVAFNKEFENKTIKAYGKIERIGVYGSDVYVMVGNAYTGIKCIAKNKDLVADLRQGENIKFYGTYKSNPYINIDMELENCVINRF